jgi:hypothetical protein
VMPEFKAGEAEREARKQAELAPYVEAALARKKRLPPLDAAATPVVHTLPRQREAAAAAGPAPAYTDVTRESAIFVPGEDPARRRRDPRAG